jgi:hypothetical protein
MSETLSDHSVAQSEIDEFMNIKKAEEKRQLLEAIFEDSVTGRSEDKIKRVEEGSAYYKHLEKLAQRDDTYDPLVAEGGHSAAYEEEWDEALADNATYDAARSAERSAFDEKIQNNPKIRQMMMIADTIAERRNRLATPETADADVQRVDDLEDRLTELLVKYGNSEDYDQAIEAAIIDRTVQISGDEANKNIEEVSSQATESTPAASASTGEQPTATPNKAGKTTPVIPLVPTFGPSIHIATPASIPAVPTFGPSIHIASPVEVGPSVEPALEGEPQEEYEARQGVSSSENEPAPIAPEEPLDQTPEQNVVTEKLDWKYALKHPGRYAAIKMNDYYQEKGVERKVRDKQITQRMLGIITGVVVAYAAYKTFDIASGMLADHHVADTAGSLGNHEVTPPTDLDLEKSHVPPAEAAPQGSGAWGPQQETFSDAAYTVDSGEGWNQTIQETTGVTDPAEQARILQKAGPELQSQGYAYFDQLKQEYRISAPGRLPNSVLQLLQNSR